MSEWIPMPKEVGQNNKSNKNFKSIAGKIIGLLEHKSESFNSQDSVYAYFDRISNGNQSQYESLVSHFNESCESKGYDASVQDIFDAVISGNLPKPKGFLNAMALTNNFGLIQQSQYTELKNN